MNKKSNNKDKFALSKQNFSQFQNIEVAIRLRPLNDCELLQNQESAWDIKKNDGIFANPINQMGSNNKFNETIKSCEVLGQG
jgi:hypothetical protein